MFNIGFGELAILGIICMFTLVPVILVAGVLLLRKGKKSDAPR